MALYRVNYVSRARGPYLQWWARGGRYISHLVQNVQYFTVLYSTVVQYRPGADGPVFPWGDAPSLAVGVGEVNPGADGRSVEHNNKTRPDYLVRGRGTMPGSLNTARAWEKKRRKMMMLNTNT